MSDKQQWHLRKEVSVINIASTLLTAAIALIFIMRLETRIALSEQRLTASEARIERFEERTDAAYDALRQDMQKRFDRLDTKLDRMNQ